MKTISFYLIMILLLLAGKKTEASELNIRLHDYGDFYLMIDHQIFDNGGNIYNIPGLNKGYYRLKVYRYYRYGYHHRSSKLIFSGNIYIEANTVVHSMISPANTYVVLSETTYFPAPAPNTPYEPYAYRVPMSPEEFSGLMGMLSETSFDSSRLKLARQALSSKYCTSMQVKELMGMLTFDSNRLSLAKYAYHRTVDTENFYLVSSALTFNSNKEELFNYIAVR